MTKQEIEFTLFFTLLISTIIGLVFSSFITFFVLFILIGLISAKYIINSGDRKEQLIITKHNDNKSKESELLSIINKSS